MDKKEIALQLALAHSDKIARSSTSDFASKDELSLHLAKVIADFYNAIYTLI